MNSMPTAIRMARAESSTASGAGRFRARLLLEGVLHLLARIFEAGLRLVNLALVLGVLVTGDLAHRLFGLAAQVVDLVLQFVFGAHALSLPFHDYLVIGLVIGLGWCTRGHRILKPPGKRPCACSGL